MYEFQDTFFRRDKPRVHISLRAAVLQGATKAAEGKSESRNLSVRYLRTLPGEKHS